jgi:hypothetical protein
MRTKHIHKSIWSIQKGGRLDTITGNRYIREWLYVWAKKSVKEIVNEIEDATFTVSKYGVIVAIDISSYFFHSVLRRLASRLIQIQCAHASPLPRCLCPLGASL